MTTTTAPNRNPWAWIPTLYFGQGIPYVVVMTLAVVMYKNLGLSNGEIAAYTSWLYLPWVIKPLWSPLVDMFRTKRFWIVVLQAVVAVSMAMVALTLPTSKFVQMSLGVLWLMAFASATHDIAADGFYMLSLPEHQQAAFVGVRSTFYRLANIMGQGALVWLAGSLRDWTGDAKTAWALVFWVLALMFVLLSVYHHIVLPRPSTDHAVRQRGAAVWQEFAATFASFFKRKDIALVLAFLLTYRLGESQALKLIAPFLLDSRAKGGLALSNQELGLVYGTLGIAALTVGGILGGLAISKRGLRAMLWPMIAAVHVPNVLFVVLALTMPESRVAVAAALMVEQFGYGFGFAAYLLFMILVASGDGVGKGAAGGRQNAGDHKTAHYALCTGFMAMGMMLPGMVSGYIQEALGYPQFFMYVCVMTLPSVAIAALLHIDPSFGKKAEA